MKILHTSDWHLGRLICGRHRYQEFQAFLDWLAELIHQEAIDVLLIAGDIFDNTTPSYRAQSLYYQFLQKASACGCQHIVIIGGNHDSPAFLNAPGALLKTLGVHVIGAITESADDEVVLLRDQHNEPALIVCAVPYLRDKDIRTVEPDETLADKGRKLAEGIDEHYQAVFDIASELQAKYGAHLPLIAMGHLFAVGGKVSDQEGVRELYVGALAGVTETSLAKGFDYVALGHLHTAQVVGNNPSIRYCGAPIAMTFGESAAKKLLQIEFQEKMPVIRTVEIPCFQELLCISGDFEAIIATIEVLKMAESNAWLEIDYQGTDVMANLQQLLGEAIAGSQLEILRVRNQAIAVYGRHGSEVHTPLESLDEITVFKRLMIQADVPENQQETLLVTYQEVLLALAQEDPLAE